jgi:hypothetical protein
VAFNKDHLSLMAVTGIKDVNGVAKGVNFWFYHAYGDVATGAGYFADALILGMTEDDLIFIPDDAGGTPLLGVITDAGTLADFAFPSGVVTTT